MSSPTVEQLIEEGCFCDEVEASLEPDTPEWWLWIAKMVYKDMVEQNPWVEEKELWAEDTRKAS